MLTSRNYDDHYSILRDLTENKIVVLYATLERLRTVDFLTAVKKNPPSLIAVNEAHCVLDWGYTFRKDYLHIRDFTKKLKHCPVIAAFTATAPPEYRGAICSHLGMEKPCICTSSLKRSNIILLEEDCSGFSMKKRLSRVKYNIKKYRKDGRTVVYCSTRKYVDMVSNYLSRQFLGEVVKCYAYMDADKREKHEMQFISGLKPPIMVATTAFGMGVNVPDIRLVLHFSLPLSTIDYYQQIGRAGRDGRKSHAMLLYFPNDIALNQHILKKEDLTEGIQEWLSDRLKEVVSIAESDQCLMQQLLKSLGEDYPTTCRHLKSSYFVNDGIRLRIYQSHDKSSGIDLIVNPSTILSGEYQPVVKLWRPTEAGMDALLKDLDIILEFLGAQWSPLKIYVIRKRRERHENQKAFIDINMLTCYSKIEYKSIRRKG